MENATQLANRFREVILNGKWIANTNFKDQLSGVTLEQAIHKTGSLNTIAALTFHINYYIAGILNVFEGGDLEIRDTYSFDMPPLNSDAGWEDMKETLFANAEKFAQHVARLTDEQLDAIFVKEAYGTFRRNIEAMIEHSYYHLGQISLLRKLIS
ncbi:MAG: DinB family protein [Saprospiraceae bacterium]|nr:DinB family protein [Saprospiraceae bacterium]